MKILHVLYSGLGGHSNVFFSLINADKTRAFEYEALFNGIEDVREDYIRLCAEQNIPWTFIKKKPGSHINFFFRLFAGIRRSKPDIIFLHGSIHAPAARLAKLLSGKKQLIVVRETQANHLKTKREFLALKIAMKLADKIVFLSKEYNEETKKLVSTYNPEKTAVIPNGLDLDLFHPASKPATDAVVIGMQSRLVPIKDHETLIKAIALIIEQHSEKNIQLTIAGDGDSRVHLEDLVKQLGIQHKVYFTGMLNEKGLRDFLHTLDIYVHASFGETMSTAIMQAMACGLPVIASDVPGINNMVEDKKTGLLVAAKDVVALANAILFMLDNPLETQKLKSQSLAYAITNFSNKSMFEKYKTVFNNIN